MKATARNSTLIPGLFLCILGFALFPFGTLHHHFREKTCEVAREHVAKPNGASEKEHLHSYKETCYACFTGVLKQFYRSGSIKLNSFIRSALVNSPLTERLYLAFQVTTNNKAPPVFF